MGHYSGQVSFSIFSSGQVSILTNWVYTSWLLRTLINERECKLKLLSQKNKLKEGMGCSDNHLMENALGVSILWSSILQF